ncbi:MAG TPA: DegV family protein [Dehalococcoidia bacterium]|nr:DegV family protein [Dehalococcoidia bacterium]
MTVRIVTDSTADLPDFLVAELGITVVPLHIHFGEETYEDGVTISKDEFYKRLVTSPKLPKTSAPSSGAFTETYAQLAEETDEIVSIHISSRLSATYQSATVARDTFPAETSISVVDSRFATIGLGLIVEQAARMARSGERAAIIVKEVEAAISRTHLFGVVDTLEYLHKGGRIGMASALLGSLLKVKPIIGVRDGIVHPIERVRGREKAFDRLVEMVSKFETISRLAVAHTTAEDEMERLVERLSGFFPPEKMMCSRCGATLGTYLGPDTLCIALLQ